MTTLVSVLFPAVLLAVTAWLSVRCARRQGGGRALAGAALSVLAAVYLYWLLLAGVTRRLTGFTELFRISSEGALLPGRMAGMALCLLFCLALGLTERGGRVLAGFKTACRKNGALWFFSLALTALFFLWVWRVTVIRFMTNDDTSLLQTIAAAGKYGISAASGAFASPLFCALLGFFYRMDPEGYWYAWYHLAVLLSACLVAGRCVLIKTRALGLSPLWGLLIAWLSYLALFFPALAELSFTVTPAAAGTAAAALVLCRDDASLSRTGRAFSDVGAVVLTLLCYLHRRATGQALLCFLALACAYQAVRLLRARDRRQLLGLAVTAAAALVLVGGCRAAESSEAVTEYDAEYYEYWDAEYYRSIVMDFLNGQLTAADLEAVGIPPELGSLLLKQWYFMDERISTETFKRLTELYYTPASVTGGASEGLLSTLASSYKDEPSYLPSLRYLCAIGALLALLCLVRFARCGKECWPELLCALCAIGGGLVLCLYIMLQGRMLYRVFLIAAMPAIITMLLCCLSMKAGEGSLAGRGWTAPLAALFAVGAGVLCVLAAYRVPYAAEYADRDTVFEAQHRTEAWANAHPEEYFVTNFASQNLDPFHGSSYPSNMHLWGGTGVTAMAEEDRLYADAFFREDVRFMCELPGSVMLLLQYLTLDHGPVAALEEAQLTGNITVFDLDRIAPGSGADGWYDWNGLRYYFRDGEALTGTQVIDGTEYEFSPAGAASMMFVKDTDAGRYYVTRACALVE